MASNSRITDRALMRVMDTIIVIVSSSAVEQYKTGITINYKRRRTQYSSFSADPYPHFVMLESNLSVEAALHWEEKVHDEVVNADGRSALARKKWDGAYIGGFTGSTGGPPQPSDAEYCFYLCWK
jgi:hypothetical protein